MVSSPRRVAVIIEDDDNIRHLISVVLEQLGFDSIGAANGLEGVEAVRNYDPVVTTLDVNMPGIDGFEAARRIRQFSATYLIMLTARDEEIDTLQGLGSGADDFMLKPFRPRELRARVEAMLRRPRIPVADGVTGPVPTGSGGIPLATDPLSSPPVPASDPVPMPASTPIPLVEPPVQTPPVSTGPSLVGAAAGTRDAALFLHNGLVLNPDTRIAELDDVELDLTRSEFDLLRALLESGRRVRSKTDLALLLRGESYITSHYVSEADRRGVEVHIANLRKKLSENPASPRLIETVRGVGYRLTARQDQ